MADFFITVLAGVKRLFCTKKYLVLLIILIIVSLNSISNSTAEYKDRLADIKEFQKVEASIFSKIPDFDKYSDIGIQVFFTPGPSSIFYHTPPAVSELYAKVNSIVDLKINNNAKTPVLLTAHFPFQLQFSHIVLFIFSLLALYLGCESTSYRDFFRSLSSTCSSTKIYFSEILSRIIFLVLNYFVILGIGLWCIRTQNIHLTSIDATGIYRQILVTLLMFLFFYFLGTLTPFVSRSKWVTKTAILILWITFLFIVPIIIYSVSDSKPDNIPTAFNLDNRKYGVLGDFEKKIQEKYGSFNKSDMETERKIIEGYYQNDFAQIVNLEKGLRDLMAKQVEKQEKLSVLSPVTFFLSTCSESSSYGNRSFIGFYDYLIDLQRQFVRFWIDHVFYNDPRVMVNFVKGDENIFQSFSRAPANFKTGVLISIGYIIVIAIFSYLSFLRSLSSVKSKEISQLGTVDLKMIDGKLNVWLVRNGNFTNLLFNLFSGNFKKMNKKGFTGKVVVNGVDIAVEKNREDFLYICRPEDVPDDMRVKDFISFYTRAYKIPGHEKRKLLENADIKSLARKTFSNLTNLQKFDVLLSLLQVNKKFVYIINDIASGLPITSAVKLKERMDDLAQKGYLMVYLTSISNTDIDLSKTSLYYMEGSSWIYSVEENKRMINYSKEKEA